MNRFFEQQNSVPYSNHLLLGVIFGAVYGILALSFGKSASVCAGSFVGMFMGWMILPTIARFAKEKERHDASRA